MDGAIRFTQRDALAAVLITAVNIVAGLIIGVLQHGLDLATAAETYTILTVGEGLVTAIPGAARLDVGRPDHHARGVGVAPRRGSRRRSCSRGRGRWPSPPACCVLPGADSRPAEARVPHRGRRARRRRLRQSQAPTRRRRWRTPRRPRRVGHAGAVVAVDPLGVEVGYALVVARRREAGRHAADARARRSASRSPPRPASSCRRCTSPTTCSSGRATYAILVKGVEVARGELYADRLLAINPGHRRRRPLDGVADAGAGVRPAGDRGSRSEQRDSAIAAGYTVVDPTTALSTHLSEIDPHVPAGPAEPPADQGDGRPRGADVAEAGRGARAEAASRSATSSACCGSCCASACRSAT